MKYIKYFCIIIVIIILSISYRITNCKKQVYDNLMIIVHPEDGLIWGGNELINNNYLVICITCNKNDKDFIRIMNKMNNDYVLLDYPDNTIYEDEYHILNRDLTYYINKYDWKKIITHNKDGEYGSIQNIIINDRVTRLVDDKDKLYYFSKYYNKYMFKYESKKYYKLSNSELLSKYRYISMFNDLEYINNFKHILDYEELVSYKDWGDLYE